MSREIRSAGNWNSAPGQFHKAQRRLTGEDSRCIFLSLTKRDLSLTYREIRNRSQDISISCPMNIAHVFVDYLQPGMVPEPL